jgi:hypothetical protein
MSPERPPRILHLCLNTAGDPLGLSRGERALGFESDVLVYDRHPFGYESDFDLALSEAGPLAGVRRRLAALRLAARYDVLHFEYGHTLIHRLFRGRLLTEIPMLKRMGKTILASFMGDDARPPEANPWGFDDPDYLEFQRRYQAPRRELMLRNADRTFYVNPDLRRWLPGAEFRPYASVDPRAIEPAPLPSQDEIVIVHAPSHRGIKGTEHVIAAVEALRADGVAVRLDLVEGVSHAEARSRYAGAHIAVDQLNVGWYGVFAVEMMALGRPVLCRIIEDEPGDNPFGEELPIVRSSPGTVREDLRALCTDVARREDLGAASRRFVEAHHDPLNVARRALQGLVPIPA